MRPRLARSRGAVAPQSRQDLLALEVEDFLLVGLARVDVDLNMSRRPTLTAPASGATVNSSRMDHFLANMRRRFRAIGENLIRANRGAATP
jgi:hypothetical protein